jgi:hypothetical protein
MQCSLPGALFCSCFVVRTWAVAVIVFVPVHARFVACCGETFVESERKGVICVFDVCTCVCVCWGVGGGAAGSNSDASGLFPEFKVPPFVMVRLLVFFSFAIVFAVIVGECTHLFHRQQDTNLHTISVHGHSRALYFVWHCGTPVCISCGGGPP